MTAKLSALLLSFFLFFSLLTPIFAASPQDGCTNPVCKDTEVCTAIGCVSTSAEASGGFFGSIMKIFVGIGGGLALVLMLYGVFIVTTSAGIPDKLKEGSEIITSAIAGLIFVLLSVVLLNLIGINILGLPGLS